MECSKHVSIWDVCTNFDNVLFLAHTRCVGVATLEDGALEHTSAQEEDHKIVHVNLVTPHKPGEIIKFRKTAGGMKGGVFRVECQGGCEGMEYIKLNADVLEGQVN